MKNVSLINFIKSSVEDEYAMNVFYNIVKDSFVKNEFSLSDVSSFYIDGRFFGEATNITFRAKYKTPKHVLALLLSVRLLIINPKFVKYCNDDNLIITSRIAESFQWVEFMALIFDNWEDEEIKMLYSLLESYYFDDDFTDEEKKEFQETIVIPEYRNERTYYKGLADTISGVANHVIGNCAFVEADIDRYVVAKDIEYVGDTAFSYCENLESLEFEGKVLFGVFPIIECPKLRKIVVPSDLVNYFKDNLPYYKEIICEAGLPVSKMPIDSHELKIIQESEKSEDYHIENLNIYDSTSVIDKVSEGIKSETQIKKAVEKASQQIDYKIIERVFDKKATSYKYFWFMAIISLAKERDSLVLSYKDILIRMAAMAWPIVFDYEIDLGRSDMLAKYLENVIKRTSLIKGASSKIVESYMNQHYNSQGVNKALAPLLKNVPYRFLSPWIPFTTNEEVEDKSNSGECDCLYALHEKEVVLDEDWWEYIKDNYSRICDFAKQSFLTYVKQYNHNMKLLKFMTNGWDLVS